MTRRYVEPKFTCGAPCTYGGRSAARKYSRADLGAWNHCNRAVTRKGDRCWQHPEAPR